MPTILEAAGVPPPATLNGISQQRLDGISMAYTFDDPKAPSRRTRQVFEVFENFAIYDDGWMASSVPVGTSWDTTPPARVAPESRSWELFDLRADYSQTMDLARKNPEKLRQLQSVFWTEAAANNILPIHPPGGESADRPSLAANRTEFVYTHRVTGIPESAAPPTMHRSFSISAKIVVPTPGARGVLVTQGGQFGGYALRMDDDGHVVFDYNSIPPRWYSVRSENALAPGAHTIVMQFAADPGGRPGGHVTISVDGTDQGRGRIEQTLNTWISHTEGFDIGEDSITSVSPDYVTSGSRFTGDLQELAIRLQ
jgi:arylsulfatase